MTAPREWRELANRMRSPLQAVPRLQQLGPELAHSIKVRTRRGADVSGSPFKPRVDGSPSTLRSSALLDGITASPTADGVVLDISGADNRKRAAAIQNGGRNRAPRRFFGLDNNQRRLTLDCLGSLVGGHA